MLRHKNQYERQPGDFKSKILFTYLTVYTPIKFLLLMINFLKIIFSVLFVFMCYKVISTSLENNLFEQWDFLGSIPWMRATLWDFYANIFIITLWMFYKEKSIILKISIVILFVCLGSIATLAYVLVHLFKLKDGEGVKELLLRR